MELLGRHVGRAADHGRAVRGDLEHARGAEVGDLHEALLGDQHVAGPQIAVDDVVRVRVVDRVGDLDGEVERARQLERALADDDALERLARDVLHHDEEDAFLLLRREHRDDVGVIEAAEQPRLVEQLAEVEVLLPMRDLDRDFLVEPRVLGEVDRAEPSAAERREDLVLSNRLPAEEHEGSIAGVRRC